MISIMIIWHLDTIDYFNVGISLRKLVVVMSQVPNHVIYIAKHICCSVYKCKFRHCLIFDDFIMKIVIITLELSLHFMLISY